MTKETFLLNVKNKEAFISMLGEELKALTIRVQYCDGDADLPVVLTALEIAKEHEVTVIGEDTDLLALLLFHKHDASKNVYFIYEEKASAKSKAKVWDITDTKAKLDAAICDNILTLHSITGCDTTSRIHSIGKGTVLQRFIADKQLKKLVTKFNEDGLDIEVVKNVGEQLLCRIMGATNEKTLDELRLNKYYRKIADCKVALTPEALGPTSDAGRLHMLRAYHQTQTWKGRRPLDLEEWGWKRTSHYILPIPMTIPPAPHELLNVIRRGCKAGLCGCKKLGIKCTTICTGCRGSIVLQL